MSVPKSGTHLLERALCLHPQLYRKLVRTLMRRHVMDSAALASVLRRARPGEVLMSHLPFREGHVDVLRDRGVPFVFLVRDPRDVAVAHVFNITRQEDHRLHRLFADEPDVRERLRLVVRGSRADGLPSMRNRLERFSGWLDAGALVVRFEDLIGAAGGGSDERQAAALASMYLHVGVDASAPTVGRMVGRLFSSHSPTFRKGQLGEWRHYFDAELHAEFSSDAGALLARYGYADAVSD